MSISNGEASLGKTSVPITNQSASSHAPSTGRRVRFDSDADIQQFESGVDDELREDLYYTRKDISSFRSNFQATVKLVETIQDAGNPDLCYHELVSRLHQVCLKNDEDETIYLPEDLEAELQGLNSISMLGLESAVHEIRRGKSIQQEEMMDRINDIQESVYCSGKTSAAEQIRAECERITRPSRKFAAQMAKIGAQAA
mmetsp:Transcript_4184/g.5492  ORF Transcript_4184/g.5492 Transcript_4184/m.5492 type:complete len:199 (-) Transcript_4184:101-697(-)|eukprot:CAMPEP_0198152368 /NCGR_PEP_ID=MMETSP1443-20131203/59559_1 /TAXON_ID=186043 /ORGANISM="Entomoneis sp., Strain CCMP2396" /LENGTH=198 /DNA_ID=CAMNT_0043818371 /DNA_START=96 /DNA_END=692 /DNA_ORIENTATION=-